VDRDTPNPPRNPNPPRKPGRPGTAGTGEVSGDTAADAPASCRPEGHQPAGSGRRPVPGREQGSPRDAGTELMRGTDATRGRTRPNQPKGCATASIRGVMTHDNGKDHFPACSGEYLRGGRGLVRWLGRREDGGVATDVISLPDGRQLSWHEFGDPDGAPVICTSAVTAAPRSFPCLLPT